MIQNVPINIRLMRTVPDTNDLRTQCPEFADEARGMGLERGMFLRDAQRHAGIPIIQLHLKMYVLTATSHAQHITADLLETVTESLADHFTKLRSNDRGGFLEQSLTGKMPIRVLASRGWRFVIPLNMLAVMSRAEAARVAGEPTSVGRENQVEPDAA